MVIACCETPNKNDDAPDGLSNNHAYTLLDVITLNGEKLAKVRNPWAKESYNGDWSDKDARWTPAMLQQAGHTLRNDGVFFLPFHKMLTKPYFRSTVTAVYEDFTKVSSY